MIAPLAAVDLLGQYLAAIARADVEGATAVFSDDVVFNMPCMPGTSPKSMTGRANVAAVLRWAFENVFATFTWVDLEMHATDDPGLAFAIATSRVILRDGRDYSNDYVMYARVRDGRIVEETEYFDSARAAVAFGSQT